MSGYEWILSILAVPKCKERWSSRIRSGVWQTFPVTCPFLLAGVFQAPLSMCNGILTGMWFDRMRGSEVGCERKNLAVLHPNRYLTCATPYKKSEIAQSQQRWCRLKDVSSCIFHLWAFNMTATVAHIFCHLNVSFDRGALLIMWWNSRIPD